ncbi:hypothetical protein EXIGLDRAFT_625046 [Exidia glandulosa HHB12029]|uniref:Reverse transcriptase zinc-binding domain-containing protein n=1 Tax=Exidia glandulosa HHB12029 TaxID=1314781 RepID=A0A165D6W7_EXIGL|nr:hypothetical protein EXIGLDRAFT_625046 [Exidia glandulosa HHB12029]
MYIVISGNRVVVLRYMEYLSRRPDRTYALAAYREAVLLARSGKQGWLMDVVIVLRALGLDIQLDELNTVTPDAIPTLQSRLRVCLMDAINGAIETGHKTYLLRDRWEPQMGSRPRQETMCLRHYLQVQTTAHRRALTRVILGCHLLAVERLAWTERYRRQVPHDERLCRFCRHAVETPEHAMLRCTGSQDLVEARTEYLAKVYLGRPDLPIASTITDSARYLQMLICDVPTIDLTASFAHRVLEIYGKAPMYIPAEYFVRS